METAAISHRVADFLKKHPPFHAMEEGDLLDLARQGRVRFFEENEYIVWQGEPYRMQVFVIQQGSVSLWDEAGQVVALRDVRGAGDMLGIEQFNDASCYPYSAKSASDVVIYAFPANEFKAFVLKYEYARRYAAAYGNVNADYQSTEERREPQNIFLHELAARKKLLSCNAHDSISEVARTMRTTGADAIAVVDSEQRAQAVLTASSFLEWIEEGGGDSQNPVASLVRRRSTRNRRQCFRHRRRSCDGRGGRRRARDYLGWHIGRPSACDRNVQGSGTGFRRSARCDSARDSTGSEHAGVTRSQSAGSRIYPPTPRRRSRVRLAGPLHDANRRPHPGTDHRAPGRR